MASIKGGASKSGITLVKGMISKGHQVLVLCPAKSSLYNRLIEDKIPVEIVPFGWAIPKINPNLHGILKYPFSYMKNALINYKAKIKLLNIIKKFNPQIIHTNSSVVNIGQRIAKSLDIPHITHYREFGWQDCHAIMCHERSMNRYHKQYGIAISKSIYKHHKLISGKDVIIYNGIYNQGQTRMTLEKEDYILFVGRLFKSKGIYDLLDAYASLENDIRDKMSLLVAGSAWSEEDMIRLLEYSSKLGISSNVKWLGERSDVEELMFHAKALVVPSYHEAFGRVVVESMANGCLVIGRNTDGLKEQFDNGSRLFENEIGMRFESTKELSSILRHIAKSQVSTFIPILKRAQSAIDQLYSKEKYIDSTEQFYRNVLNRRDLVNNE